MTYPSPTLPFPWASQYWVVLPGSALPQHVHFTMEVCPQAAEAGDVDCYLHQIFLLFMGNIFTPHSLCALVRCGGGARADCCGPHLWWQPPAPTPRQPPPQERAIGSFWVDGTGWWYHKNLTKFIVFTFFTRSFLCLDSFSKEVDIMHYLSSIQNYLPQHQSLFLLKIITIWTNINELIICFLLCN